MSETSSTPPSDESAQAERLAKRLPDRALLLLATMHDRSGLMRRHTVGRSDLTMVEVDGRETPLLELPGRPDARIVQRLVSDGLVVGFSAARIDARLKAATGGRYAAHYSVQYDGVGALGRAVAKAARGRIDAVRALIAEAEDAPRYLAIRPQVLRLTSGAGFYERGPGVGSLAMVVSETPKGYRVLMVDPATMKADPEPRLVMREDVALLDVDPARFPAMLAATEDYRSRVGAAEKGTEDEIEAALAPIRRRLEQRRAQLLAQLEDEMREIGEAAPGGPAP